MSDEIQSTATGQTGGQADQDQGVNNETQNNEGQNQQTENEKKTTFTLEDLQKYADKRVTEAVKTNSVKFSKEIENLKKEIELSKLNEKEREVALKKQKEEEYNQKISELQKKEVNYETRLYIAEKGLDSELIESLDGVQTLEDRKKIIDKIIEVTDVRSNEKVGKLRTGSFINPNDKTEKPPDDPIERIKYEMRKQQEKNKK